MFVSCKRKRQMLKIAKGTGLHRDSIKEMVLASRFGSHKNWEPQGDQLLGLSRSLPIFAPQY
jgi:hypothetical protein